MKLNNEFMEYYRDLIVVLFKRNLRSAIKILSLGISGPY